MKSENSATRVDPPFAGQQFLHQATLLAIEGVSVSLGNRDGILGSVEQFCDIFLPGDIRGGNFQIEKIRLVQHSISSGTAW